jgi:hypothetical protein
MSRSKAEVEIYVRYAGKEWSDSGECDPEYLYDDLSDLVAGIDYDVREEYEKRRKLLEDLKK